MAEEIPAGIRFRADIGPGVWWPDYDHAPEKCYEFVRNGLPAIDVLRKYCREGRRRVAVQAGGHAGFWPKALAKNFGHVHTFEPEQMLFECMTRNCTAPNVTMYRHGLGNMCAEVGFMSHVSAGSWKVDPAGDHRITLLTVDSLNLKHCDALLLDIEGYECFALDGARATIARCQPVVLVELLPRSKDAIAEWLTAAGYRMAERFGRDGIFTYQGKP